MSSQNFKDREFEKEYHILKEKIFQVWGKEAKSAFYLDDVEKMAMFLVTARPISKWRKDKKHILDYMTEVMSLQEYDIANIYILINIHLEDLAKRLIGNHRFISVGIWYIYIIVAIIIDLIIYPSTSSYKVPCITVLMPVFGSKSILKAINNSRLLKLHLYKLRSPNLKRGLGTTSHNENLTS